MPYRGRDVAEERGSFRSRFCASLLSLASLLLLLAFLIILPLLTLALFVLLPFFTIIFLILKSKYFPLEVR